MKALLMHHDRDFDARQREFTRHELALIQDLELETLINAMSAGDEFVGGIAREVFLSGLENDIGTILYRQEILKDCLNYPTAIRQLYALAVETIEGKRKRYLGIISNFPAGTLYDAIQALEFLLDMLGKLKAFADAEASRFRSKGLTALLAMLQREFTDDYFASIQEHLRALKFTGGVLVSAELGIGDEGTNYILRRPHGKPTGWLQRLLGKGPPSYSFRLHPRDEAGARILSSMRDRGINLVANALGQSTDHILSFFIMLRTELAFYIGCLNLHARLTPSEIPVSFPNPRPVGERRLRFSDLHDVSLSLTMKTKVVGNDLNADGKRLVLITGANQGGKSSFLRSVGLAQLMMQSGMFVPAESFIGELCTELFTHYKREEDASMKSGKFVEELARMSNIVDAVSSNSVVLFNESFASTNEREGSEIARQIVQALVERRVKVFFVTHLFEFAHGLFEDGNSANMFLRAERRDDGTRTFKVVEGEPLETSFGEDLYKQVFKIKANVMSDQCTTSNPNGFSLVQLLVVLGVIAIVIGFLLPTIASARRSARIVACASNLRQLGQALRKYEVDYNSWPTARLMPFPYSSTAQESLYPPLYTCLSHYLAQNSPAYHCPADDGQVYDRCAAVSPAQLGMSYLYISKWPARLRGKEHIMWDYNGLNDEHRSFRLFHQNGENALSLDGSVSFTLDSQR